MRVVAIDAILTFEFAQISIPAPAGSSMDARLPVPVSWAVTTAAKGRAIGEFQLASVARLQAFQVGFVMAIVTIIVPVVTTVPHDDVFMFLRHN